MTVLNTLLEITIYSAVLFGAIWLFRILLKKQLSPVMLYAMWFILIARLIMPVTITSGFSFITIPAVEQPAAYSESVDLTEMLDNKAAPAQNVPYSDVQTTHKQEALSEQLGKIKPVQSDTISSSNSKLNITWQMVLVTLWLAGIAVMLIQISISILQLRKRIRSAQAVPAQWQRIAKELQKELGFKHSVRIVIIEGFPSPALCGGINPVIVLPSEMAGKSEESIRFALLHEMTHIKRGDHIVSMLLLLLRAVYWFNPFVWLMMKQMRLDIETACDSCLTKPMSTSTKKRYAGTMLSMYAQQQIRYVLGMSLGQTKKTAERRLRGMFMRSRSSRKGKMIAILLTTVLIVTCFTTACQPTPEEKVVISKNDDVLENAIAATPLPDSTSFIEGAQPDNLFPTNMIISERWQDTLSENNVTIYIDADVLVPNVSAFPVYEVAPFHTDEALAKKFIGVFAKDAVEIHNGAFGAPEDYERTIISIKKEISELEAGKTTDDDRPAKEQIDEMEEILVHVEKEYDDSKKESDLVGQPLDFSFEGTYFMPDTDNVKDRMLEFTATMEDGSTRRIGFQNTQNSTLKHTCISCFNTDAYRTYEIGELISTDEALGIAMQTIKELNIGEFDFKHEIIKFPINENTGEMMENPFRKDLIFSKKYSGISVNQYRGADNHECVPEEELVYNVVLRQEEIRVTFSKDGMIGFSWLNPCAVQSTANENVAVISFDEAMDIFNQQILYNIYPHDEYETKIAIHEVRLGYMVIPVKDDLSTFRTIPVWDFIGVDKTYADEQRGDIHDEERSYLTINAIDGSIIDRGLGY